MDKLKNILDTLKIRKHLHNKPAASPGESPVGLIVACVWIFALAFSAMPGCTAETSGNTHPGGKSERFENAALRQNDRTKKLHDGEPQKVSARNPTEGKPNVREKDKPAQEIKLDSDLLAKLDNTKYSWGLVLNSRHKTPGVPDHAKKLLARYDGIYLGNPDKKTVYITFDEGYENGYTPEILDTLKKEDAKALFFVTGPYVKSHPELVKRMLDEGHQVGNHTINHPSLPELDSTGIEKEVNGLAEEYYRISGRKFKYFRPPKGEYSERTLAALKQLGYKTVFWSFAYMDFDTKKQMGKDHAYKMVMDNLHNGAVILLHAVSSDNARALDEIIRGIRAQGYEISPFDL